MEEQKTDKTQDVITLLLVWMDNAKRAQIAHFESANRFSRLNYWLGIPVVVLSAIVGTSVFATLQKSVTPHIQIAIGMISVLAAILASLQTFLNFNNRASKHHTTASEYESVKRQIQEALVLQNFGAKSCAQQIAQVRGKLDSAGKNAPPIPSKIWNVACKRVPFTKEALSYEKSKG